MKKINFTTEQEEEIIQLYQQNWTLNSLGKKFGVNRNVIKRILIAHNIIVRKKTHKYIANYRIFETIDSVEKAYWLGFIAADGCVYERTADSHGGAMLRINLNSKDRQHLVKFQEFLKTNAQITDYITNCGFSNNTPMSAIIINSNDMIQDLKDKGVGPHKSLTLKPPIIKEEFFLPFIKGYFDGDGSIWKTNQNTWGISFEGTKEVLEWIAQVLNWTDVKLEQRYDNNKNNYYIRCGGTHKPYQLIQKFYNSCNIALDRKHKKFITLETVVLSSNT